MKVLVAPSSNLGDVSSLVNCIYLGALAASELIEPVVLVSYPSQGFLNLLPNKLSSLIRSLFTPPSESSSPESLNKIVQDADEIYFFGIEESLNQIFQDTQILNKIKLIKPFLDSESSLVKPYTYFQSSYGVGPSKIFANTFSLHSPNLENLQQLKTDNPYSLLFFSSLNSLSNFSSKLSQKTIILYLPWLQDSFSKMSEYEIQDLLGKINNHFGLLSSKDSEILVIQEPLEEIFLALLLSKNTCIETNLLSSKGSF